MSLLLTKYKHALDCGLYSNPKLPFFGSDQLGWWPMGWTWTPSNQISRTRFLEPLFYTFLEKWLQIKWSITHFLYKLAPCPSSFLCYLLVALINVRLFTSLYLCYHYRIEIIFQNQPDIEQMKCTHGHT